MNLAEVLRKANEMIAYVRTRKKRKLYTQWVERAGLPIQALPGETLGVSLTGRKGERSKAFLAEKR